jgi:ribosomal protein S8
MVVVVMERCVNIKNKFWQGRSVHIYNPSTQAEAGILQVLGQSGYIVSSRSAWTTKWVYLKKKKKKKWKTETEKRKIGFNNNP